MSKFVSIYQTAIRKKTLRDEIPVMELPRGIQEELRISEQQQAVIDRFKLRDRETALARLRSLQKQLSAGK